MKLYYAPNTRSVRPRWLLEELSVPYDLVRLDLSRGDHKKPEYLAINPMSHIPTFIDDDICLFETTAITMHIADKFVEQGFAPSFGSPQRADYYKWLFFASSLERHFKRYKMLKLATGLDQELNRRLEESRNELLMSVGLLSDHLRHKRFLLGEQISAADINCVYWILEVIGILQISEQYPELNDYIERLIRRPARIRATD